MSSVCASVASRSTDRTCGAAREFVRGAWEQETGRGDETVFRWLGQRSLLRIPQPEDHDDPPAVRIRLAADRAVTVGVTSGSASTTLRVDRTPRWFDVAVLAPAIDVVNNAGTVLVDGCLGADRGLYEPDGPAFDVAQDVFAWCGGGVVMPMEYLRDVGVFDERLFLYYEDVELAWRGRRHGWRYRYVPDSVVRHVHTASSVDGSALKAYYDGRNHLLVALRHAPWSDLRRAITRYVLATGSYGRRDILSPVLHGHRPTFATVRVRCRALGGFACLAPGILRDRRR